MLRFIVRFFFHNKKRTFQAIITLTLALVIFISTTLLVRGYAGNISGLASIIRPSNYYLITEKDMSLSESKLGFELVEFLEEYSIIVPNVEVVLPQIYMPVSITGETGENIQTHLRLLNLTRFEQFQSHKYSYTLTSIDENELIIGQQINSLLSLGFGAEVNLDSETIYINNSYSYEFSDNFTIANILESKQEYDIEVIGDIDKLSQRIGIEYYSFIEFKIKDTRELEKIIDDITNEFSNIEITEEKQTQNFIIFATEEVIRTLTLLQTLFFVLMLVSITYSIYTLVKESEEEIFILRSIGATKAQIVFLFMSQALFIGFISALLSLIIGYLAVSGIVAVVSAAIGLPFLALNVESGLVGSIFLFSLGISLLSGIYPSFEASKIRVIREEH